MDFINQTLNRIKGEIMEIIIVFSCFTIISVHPLIYPLIEGGETVEYSAHLVAEESYRGIHKNLHKKGLLVIGEAAGFVVNAGYTIHGIDLAIVSGLAAAKAIIKESNLEKLGAVYMSELDEYLLPFMKSFDGFTDAMNISRVFDTYPNFAIDFFERLYKREGNGPFNLKKELIAAMNDNNLTIWKLIQDAFKARKVLK